MKKIYNKLIILSTIVVLFSVTAVAQIRTFNSPNNGVPVSGEYTGSRQSRSKLR